MKRGDNEIPSASNITHPMYGKGLMDGLRDIIQKISETRKSKKASEKPNDQVVASVPENVAESAQSSAQPTESALQTPIVSNDADAPSLINEVKIRPSPEPIESTAPVNEEPQSALTGKNFKRGPKEPLEQTRCQFL